MVHRARPQQLTPALLLALALAAALPARAFAQAPDSTGVVNVIVHAGEAPLADVSLSAGAVRALTDVRGRGSLRLRAGARLIMARKVGYHPDTLEVVVRAGADTTINATMLEETEELEAITVQTTRTTRHIEDEPTRVEILAGADIAEKTSMRPQDLSNFLSEMSGVRIQQTAPGRGGAAIRIQGMRGQYTQVLSDGLPLSGSVPSGLMLLQLPPVDLLQVEVIKGAATALYGPGALGGIMNLVSRRPDNRTDLVLSARAPAGGDGFLWTSRQLGERGGLSFTGDVHAQQARDNDGDGWMDLNGYSRFGVRPRYHWTGVGGATLLATIGGMSEHRTGGTMPGRTAPDNQPFDNGVDTRRLDGGVIGTIPAGRVMLRYRAAAALLTQDAHYGVSTERGRNRTLFGEVTAAAARGHVDGMVGVSIQQNRYRNFDVSRHDYTFTTPSVFGQLTWALGGGLSATVAGRCDDHSRYGTVCSPRLSALYHIGESSWNVRLSGGTGFFASTPFTEETEPIGLTPLAALNVVAERGRNASLDVTGDVGKVELTMTLFANEVRQPLTLVATPPASPYPRQLVNAPEPARTSGGEIFAVYDVAPVVVTASYSSLWATEIDGATGARHETARSPRHNFFVDLAYETHTTWIALEVSWLGRQALSDDPSLTVSRSYANVELLASKTFGPLTVYANADNLFDVRQTSYEPLLRPSRQPGESWTVGQWAPVEGRLISVGMRRRF